MNGQLVELAKRARNASLVLASADTLVKNKVLEFLREELLASKEAVLEANKADIEQAEHEKVDYALIKRLNLAGDKYRTLLHGLEELEKHVNDPVGLLSLATKLDDGLELYRVACPIGVLCIIFESRPDAAVQIASLAIKSGNTLILKGGKEAKASNEILVQLIRNALSKADLPADCVQLVSTREEVKKLLELDEYIDLVIPRGSNKLVRYIMKNTSIPVLGHADGICTVYIDDKADLEKAVKIVVDSKTQYPAVCNAAETLLIHKDGLERIFPSLAKALMEKGVTLHADKSCTPFVKDSKLLKPLTDDSLREEYLRLEMNVLAVDSINDAIMHINTYGSHHTDCIVTEDMQAAEVFLRKIDSAGVFHNCSTRFADGFRYGFGAEIGVSTNRIHARGPVGLEGLVIYKYRLHGNGHCVASYGPGKRSFKHEPISFNHGTDSAPRLA